MLLLLQALQRLQEGLAALLVQDGADADELARIVPLVVAQEHVERVELEDLHARVEIRGVSAPLVLLAGDRWRDVWRGDVGAWNLLDRSRFGVWDAAR